MRYFLRLFIVVDVTFMVFLTSCLVRKHEPGVYYVSPGGSDTSPGSFKKPFATLSGARDAVRAFKHTDGLVMPVTVYLRGGTYELTEPVVFFPGDSGTESCPVTYTAYPGETPIISGGTVIQGWAETDNGLWKAELPETARGEWNFKQLYVNGTARPRTRLPKDGYFRIADFPLKDHPPWSARAKEFTFKPGDIRADWKNLADVEVVVLRFWVSSRQLIERVDESTNKVMFTAETRYRYSDDFTKDGARYYVENVIEALDEPGGWYLDRSEGILYYKPMPGETIGSVEVVAPVTPQFIRLEGNSEEGRYVTDITFDGLTFANNNWMLPEGQTGDGQSAPEVEGSVYMTGAERCAFTGCTFRDLSSYGIQIDAGCRYNSIVGNELGRLGGGGIRMGGGAVPDHPLMRTGNNRITDNHIHHIGLVYHAATGVWITNSFGNTIAHNHIHHTYYSSVAVGWVWGYNRSLSTHNIFEYNHIHHIGQGMLSDMGGFYLLGIAPGTVVRNNLVHDVESHGYGGWGIYTDEGSTHVLIENNIVYRTKFAGFNQHYGRENIVRNNIFALGKEAQISRSRIEEHRSFFFENNIVYWKEGRLLAGRWTNMPYPHRHKGPFYEAETDTVTYVCDYNLYFNPESDDIRFADWTLGEWQARGQDTHSMIADPLFADPENGDFALKQDSPALKLGFKPIDMSTVGPRPEFSNGKE
ncbi:right-handed parallel beta-helix repeat-containing protein [Candidatus Latescibacterota bacterium]